MYTAEEKLGGEFVVEVGGMPGFTSCYLAPDGDGLTAHLSEAGRWWGYAEADRVAAYAIESWGEADYWIMADPKLVSEVTK